MWRPFKFRFWHKVFGNLLLDYRAPPPFQLTNISFFPHQGFAYANVQDKKAQTEIMVNDEWGSFNNKNKTNTALQYNEDYSEVISWGTNALSPEPSRRKNKPLPRPVEYFRLYLSDVPESKKPKLPSGITFEKAITDYLREMGNSQF